MRGPRPLQAHGGCCRSWRLSSHSGSSNLGRNLHFTFVSALGRGEGSARGGRLERNRPSSGGRRRRNRQACKMGGGGQIEVFASALNQCVCN